MRIIQLGGQVQFWAGDRLAGVYRADDPRKPHFARLLTPTGHDVIVCQPHDHPHHKGCQFGLLTSKANFWEEHVHPELPLPPGFQEPRSLLVEKDFGAVVAIRQELVWLAGDPATEHFGETRRLSCEEARGGFLWTWSFRLKALRDARMIKPPWSLPKGNGTTVGYHGFGLRLPRSFSGTGGNSLQVNGTETTFADALGQRTQDVEFVGCLDAGFPVSRVAISLTSSEPMDLFVIENPFAYLSLCPFGVEEGVLSQGDALSCTYQLHITDR